MRVVRRDQGVRWVEERRDSTVEHGPAEAFPPDIFEATVGGRRLQDETKRILARFNCGPRYDRFRLRNLTAGD
jgi:hypothetical protein